MVIRTDPSRLIDNSARPGVASMSISIGELDSTVEAGIIVTPYVVDVVVTRLNLTSGEVAMTALEPSMSSAITILVSCVIPVIFFVKRPVSSDTSGLQLILPLSLIFTLLFLRVLPLMVMVSLVILVPFSGVNMVTDSVLVIGPSVHADTVISTSPCISSDTS